MNENIVENNIVKQVRKARGVAYKFTSPARNGVTDRLCLFPIPPKHRKIVSKYIRFVEAKAPGEVLRPDQVNEIALLRELGFKVEVVDDPKWSLE